MSVLNSNPFLIASGSPNDPAVPLQRSVRLRSSASAYFNRTQTTTTNSVKCTFSGWVKRGTLGVLQVVFGGYTGTDADTQLYFDTTNQLKFTSRITNVNGAAFEWVGESAAVFRDPSAWYHIVVTVDTSTAQATNNAYYTVYVNNVAQTFTTVSGASLVSAATVQNRNTCWNVSGYSATLGRQRTNYFDGYLTEVNFIDGQALTPSSFGGYNAGTNVWEVRKYSGTYGTNGFYLPFTLDTTSTYAGSFNGTAKYISAPNNAVFAQQSATNWTVEGWVYSNSATLQQLFVYGNSTISTGNDVAFGLAYTPGSTASLFQYNGTTNTLATSTLNVPLGQWCHIAAVNNGGTVTIYINGVACGTCAAVNTNSSGTFTFYVGNYGSSRYINGQVSNFRLVKGTAVYTSNFVPTTTPLTAITNTALLTLQNATIVDNSTNAFTLTNTGSLTTIAATPYVANVASDASGNKNNWIPNNINASVSGVTYDSMLDVPTNTGPTNANFCIANPLDVATGLTISDGNLKLAASTSVSKFVRSSIALPTTGAFYAEIIFANAATSSIGQTIGICTASRSLTAVNNATGAYLFYASAAGALISNGTTTASSLTTISANELFQLAIDVTNSKMWLGRNNVWYNSTGGTTGDPSTGANPTFTGSFVDYYIYAGFDTASAVSANLNFGQRPFAGTVPSGFKALNTYNLPEPTIPRGDKYFKQYLYTGNGGGQQIGEIQKPASLFNLDRSLRFRSSNSAYLSRTPASAGNRKTWTWSGWVKRGTLGGSPMLFANNFAGTGGLHYIQFNSDTLFMYVELSAGIKTSWQTTAIFKDPNMWYHIAVVFDTTQSVVANMGKIYVNGILQTITTNNYSASYISQNADGWINASSYAHYVGSGRGYYTNQDFDGYLADVYFIDGQALTPTSFGAYDGNNYWTPKAYTGTYGTNGFHLEFEDYSASTATAIGKDTSGNGNNWTPSAGINLTTPANTNASWDSMVDVPTQTSADVANYCTLNPLRSFVSGSAATFTNGNLNVSIPAVANPPRNVTSTLDVFSGKWYWEVIAGTVASNFVTGIASKTMDFNATIFTTGSYLYDATSGNKNIGGTASAYGASYTTNDVIGIALDMDAGTLTFYKNGASQGVAVTGLQGLTVTPVIAASGSSAITGTFNFGQRPFRYSNYGTDRPDATFKPINSFNIAEVIGDVETPDLVRIKSRSATTAALWFNSVSGAGKYLTGNNSTAAEATDPNSLIQFNKNGLLIGNNANINTSAATYIAEVWKKSAISGIDVVNFTNTSTSASFNHSLGTTPAFIILKGLGPTAANWTVFHKSLGNMTSAYLNLNTTGSLGTLATAVPAPTLTTFGSSSAAIPASQSSIAFLFAEIPGFSKFDSYISNGSSTDGPFVYTGFRPRWVMIKQRDATRSWIMYDTTRNTYNVVDKYFFMEGLNNNEQTAALLDINSNGFKLKNNNLNTNTTAGSVYIYMAFAENPFKYALAR